MSIEHEVARAVLTVALGSKTNADTIWAVWTPAQRDEAAAVAAHFIPALERMIERMKLEIA